MSESTADAVTGSDASATTPSQTGPPMTETSGSTAAVDTETSTQSAGEEESTAGSSGTSETASGGTDDPWTLCASATTEGACEAIEIPTGDWGKPSCQWLTVHTLPANGEMCELLDSGPQCLFFSGFIEGCLGGGSCGVPEQGQMYIRDLGGTTELIFYPYPEICGPYPTARVGEPDWVDCVEPPHSACECVCEVT
jgi:hypothetical protein